MIVLMLAWVCGAVLWAAAAYWLVVAPARVLLGGRGARGPGLARYAVVLAPLAGLAMTAAIVALRGSTRFGSGWDLALQPSHRPVLYWAAGFGLAAAVALGALPRAPQRARRTATAGSLFVVALVQLALAYTLIFDWS